MSHNARIMEPYMTIAVENRARFESVLANIHMPFGWTLQLTTDPKSDPVDPRFWLHVHAKEDKCARTGVPYEWSGREWILEPDWSDSQIIRTAWLATRAAVEHELFEYFTYNGTPLFDPHTNLPKLAAFVADNADQP